MNVIGTKETLITCICIFTAAGLSFALKNDYEETKQNKYQKVKEITSGKLSNSTHTSRLNLEQITKLFGQASNSSQQAPPIKKLPETRLDLTLKGTFTHKDNDKASALISENSKSATRFFLGDKIPGGAELIAVRKGEITLRRNGQDELLKLPYLKTDERIIQNSQRRTPSSKQTSSVSRNSQTESNSNSNKSLTNVTNNPHQQQLKDRLARLRNNKKKNSSNN